MQPSQSLVSHIAEWWDERQAQRRPSTAEIVQSRRFSRWMPNRGSVIFTLLVVGLLLLAQTAGALPLPDYLNMPDAPSTGAIAYQGRLADAEGNPLTSTVNMEFRLYNATTGGTPLWSELWTGANSVQVSDGLFNVMLGSLTPIPQAIVTDNGSLWLGITAGTDDEMMPRVQLGSVPFAVQALTVPDGSVTTAKLADGAASGLWYAKGMSTVTTSSTDWVTLTDMLVVINSTGGPVLISFDTGFAIMSEPDAGYVGFGIFIDGNLKTQHAQRVYRAGESTSMQITHVEALSPGSHVVEIKWRVSSTAVSARINNANQWEQRVLVVQEVRR